jgi:hypothetical protein
MPRYHGVLARRWRLVHEAERLGSARKAAQECRVAVRIVEMWCRLVEATGTMHDTSRAGMSRAPLASREPTRHLKEGVKRGDHFPQFAKALQQKLRVIVSAETGRRYIILYLRVYMHASAGFATS